MEYESRLYVNALTVNDQGKDVIKTFFDDQAAAIPEEDIFWRDWRTEDGELAWLERFPEPSKNRYARFWRAAYLRMADCELRQACAFPKHYPPENYVIEALSDSLELMAGSVLRWLSAMRTRLGQRLDLLLEFIVLRHQLAVLQRTGTRRPCSPE